jgi:tRNA threonylcarbamoyladenosine modification (KEOPS) complex  Pcc1 subunit
MSRRRPPWTATVTVATGRSELARWLERALAPEAAREVPRARTSIERTGASLRLRVEASDAGAMRAALNTYLGWVALSIATAETAERSPGTGGRPGPSSLPGRPKGAA